MNKAFVIILCFLCLIVYVPSFNNGFIFDDNALIVHNPFIKSVKLLPQIFKSGVYDHWAGVGLFDRMYRPLQVFSYWVDYHVWGLKPFGFRISNILLHLFNAILIYYLLVLIFKNSAIPLATGLLFFIHPLNSSLASYISGRADLLSAFFMIFSMVLFLRYLRLRQNNIFYFLSLLSGMAAFFCRENAGILFLFIALILAIEKVKARDYLLIVPFILLSILYFIVRFVIFGPSGLLMHPEILPFSLRLVNFLNIIFKYLLLLFLPLDLHFLRGTAFIRDAAGLNAAIVWSVSLFLIGLFIRLRKKKEVFLSVIWFLAGLLPVLFLLDAYPAFRQAMMAESWVYLSSAGFFVLFVFAVSTWFKNIGLVIINIFIIFYSLLSIANSVYLRDNIIVHKRILQYGLEPNPVRKDLVDDYLAAGLYERAFEEARKLSGEYPDTAFSDMVWGNCYFATRNAKQALASYNAALSKMGRGNFFLYYRLSLCYKIIGDKANALDFRLRSFNANPYCYAEFNKDE